MMTLSQAKKVVAQHYGFSTWDELSKHTLSVTTMERNMDLVAKILYNSACKETRDAISKSIGAVAEQDGLGDQTKELMNSVSGLVKEYPLSDLQP